MDIARSSAKLFGAKVGSALIVNIGLIYFARSIGPEELGSFFLFQTTLGLLTIPADFGIRGALEKRLSEGEERERYLSTALLIKISSILLVSLGIFAGKGIVNNYIGLPLAKYLIIAIVLQELSLLFIRTLHGEFRVGETALIKLARQSVWVFGGMLFITIGLGAISIVYSFLIGLIVMLIWSLIKIRVSFGRPSLSHASSLFNFSKYHFISSNVGWKIYQWSDVFFIGLFLSQSLVSTYELAWRVSMLVVLISDPIASTIFPYLSKLNSEGEKEQTISTIDKAIRVTLFISIPAFAGGAVMSAEILGALFGPQYATASFALSLLLLEKVFRSVQAIYARALQALDRPDLLAGAMAVTVFLNITLNYILVPRYGIAGAAVATLASFMINTIITTFFITTKFRFIFPTRVALASTLSTGVMVILLILIKRFSPLDGVYSVFIYVSVGVLIYIGMASIIPTTREKVIKIGIRDLGLSIL